MKLSEEKIQSIATGISYISKTPEGRLRLHRFTPAEEKLYRKVRNSFYTKTLCSSGIKLSFSTDSKSIYIKGATSLGTTRSYMATEVYENGKRIGLYTNYSDMEIPKAYAELNCSLGDVECCFSLTPGDKQIDVYLPWSVILDIDEISVDNGAYVTPIKRDRLMLAYGDSITQGYDALKPYNRYSCRLAELLGADEHNKAVGGEIFFPALAKLADKTLKPDYVTVAYGTNDWYFRRNAELFKADALEFLREISNAYPKAKIFVFTPIWRKETESEAKSLGSLEKMADTISALAADIPNLYVIRGYDAVPHAENYFADLRLHPNDEGYRHQVNAFYEKMKGFV